jgi:hypothetical protein
MFEESLCALLLVFWPHIFTADRPRELKVEKSPLPDPEPAVSQHLVLFRFD